MSTESMVTQADFEAIMDRLEKSPMNLTGKRWRDTPDDPALVELREHFILPIIEEYVRRHRTAAQPEREAVALLRELRDNIGAASLARNPIGMSIRDRVDIFLRDAALTTPAPAVSTDEIVAVFSENLPEQAARLGVHHNGIESPGQWRDRVRKAAILSRLRGEG